MDSVQVVVKTKKSDDESIYMSNKHTQIHFCTNSTLDLTLINIILNTTYRNQSNHILDSNFSFDL